MKTLAVKNTMRHEPSQEVKSSEVKTSVWLSIVYVLDLTHDTPPFPTPRAAPDVCDVGGGGWEGGGGVARRGVSCAPLAPRHTDDTPTTQCHDHITTGEVEMRRRDARPAAAPSPHMSDIFW